MADIFLSYSNQDVNRVRVLVEVLERQGWSVWWDHKIRIGHKFARVIEEEIGKAKCIVVVWSRKSVQSDWVTGEAGEGKRRQILVPVLIDNVTVPLEFRGIEAARLHDWKGDLAHPEVKPLLDAIGEVIAQPPKLTGESDTRKTRTAFGVGVDKLKVVALTLLAVAAVAGAALAFRHFFPAADTFIEKTAGDGLIVPYGTWGGFDVRVVDAQARPVAGARVAFQTPYCGLNVYVGETNREGKTGATLMCNVIPPGTYKQTASLVGKDTPAGFTHLDRIKPIGEPVEFTFHVAAPAP